jgi:SAM-dependent methyltransferase
MPHARAGPSIREFLAYYFLVLLGERRRTTSQLVEEIEARSAENRSFRSTGALRVSRREAKGVIGRLAERGWVRPRPPDARWGITNAGRSARREMKQRVHGGSDSKGRAASKLIARLKDAPKGSNVLDVGTGEGFLAWRLARQGFRVLGIDSGAFDYSKDSIEKAQQSAGSDAGRLRFRKADVTRLSRPSGGFDFVVASQAVHCMKHQHKCLRAIHGLLKPGGRFLSLDFLVGLEGFLEHGFHCFLAISREEWAELLPSIGFDDLHMAKVKDYVIVDARKAHGCPGDSESLAGRRDSRRAEARSQIALSSSRRLRRAMQSTEETTR